MTDQEASEPDADPERRTDDDTASRPARGARRRLPTLLGWSALALLVVGVAWIVVTGLIARSRLESARQDIAQLRSAVERGDTSSIAGLTARIDDATTSAHDLTTGPAWWVAANLPVIGEPLRTTRVVAEQGSRLGRDVLPGVLEVARTVPAARRGSTIDLTVVQKATPVLQSAAATARSALAALQQDDGSWFGPVRRGRDEVLDELRTVSGALDGAARAARVVPTMLGAQAPQRFFVGFLNEAESRGGGGIPAAFAIAVADRGSIRFERFGTETYFDGYRSDIALPADYRARYGASEPDRVIVNSNLSPDFATTARIWAGFWKARTGETVTGAVALDPTALSYLLRVTGSFRADDGQTVSADDVVALTQQKQYALFPGTSRAVTIQRKNYLTGLARSISAHLTSGGSPVGLVRAVSRAAGERRFTVWSADPAVESLLEDAGWSGALGNSQPAPYAGFVVNNAAGSKLDYYLRRGMTYRRTDCGAGGRATATLTLTNGAPRSGLPPYVTIRADDPPKSVRPGDNRLLVTYFADRSARILSLAVDGRAQKVVTLPEGTTSTVTTTVEIPAGATVTVTVQVAEPPAEGAPTILEQPLVSPLRVDLSGNRCR